MTTIVHVSDLHFGREDPPLVEALREDIRAIAPTLVAVSGDLTQRARRVQFRAARAWLSALRAPVLVVPGNHDVPLFDVFRRFARPLRRYCEEIAEDLTPFFHSEDLAVLGLNTARSTTWKNGRISVDQMEAMRERLGPLPPRVFKVLVTHHPFMPPPGARSPATVGRGLRALVAAEAAGVDLLLSGHLHLGYMGDVRAHHVTLNRSMLVAQAGTAISTRVRGEPNTYNRIDIDPPHVTIEVRGWTGRGFGTRASARWVKRDGEWTVD